MSAVIVACRLSAALTWSMVHFALKPVQPRAQHMAKASSKLRPAIRASLPMPAIAVRVTGAFFAFLKTRNESKTSCETPSGVATTVAVLFFFWLVVSGSWLMVSGLWLALRSHSVGNAFACTFSFAHLAFALAADFLDFSWYKASSSPILFCHQPEVSVNVKNSRNTVAMQSQCERMRISFPICSMSFGRGLS